MEKENEIDELIIEISLLHRLLEDSLALYEYEEGKGCHWVMVCELIREKITKIQSLC